jgi:hypothetical protein
MNKYFILIFLLTTSIIGYQYFVLKSFKAKIKKLEDGKKEIKEEKLHLLIFLFSVVFILWLFGWFLMDTFIDAKDIRGQFGDQFGSINALFSGFALAGIIYTIVLQKKELSLQREELEETREEFKIQNVTLKKQRFENTFFQLLKLHNDIVENMNIDVFDGKYEKRKFFEGALKQLKFKSANFEYYKYSFLLKLTEVEINLYLDDKTQDYNFLIRLDDNERREIEKFSKELYTEFKSISIDKKEENIQKDYLDFFTTYQDSLGHYFRNLYHIFKYVYFTDLIVEEEKRVYSNIVRAQLSSDELVLLFYNSLTPIHFSGDKPSLGYPKFKYLIEHFDVLQNMTKTLLLDISHSNIFDNNKINQNPFVK